jgi:hypothetical protein
MEKIRNEELKKDDKKTRERSEKGRLTSLVFPILPQSLTY